MRWDELGMGWDKFPWESLGWDEISGLTLSDPLATGRCAYKCASACFPCKGQKIVFFCISFKNPISGKIPYSRNKNSQI